MKVLEKGSGQKGWSTKLKCTGTGNGGGGCGALLLVEAGDLMKTHSSAMGESDYHATWECVECKVLNDIPWSKVPSLVTESMPYVPSGRRRRWRLSDPRD